MGAIKEIDELDHLILSYLKKDARNSLKRLADAIGKKSTTVYHRLDRLEQNNIIKKYLVIVDPDILNIAFNSQVKIKLKSQNLRNFDKMFIENFANYLKEEFGNITFIGLLNDSDHPDSAEIMCIVSFKDQEHHDDFINKLKKNPYVASIKEEKFIKIIKGDNIFEYNPELVKGYKSEFELIDPANSN
ncbi:MAG: Lrp/AsnC family transcriptional regulator [Promethearchaeota archaeon]